MEHLQLCFRQATALYTAALKVTSLYYGMRANGITPLLTIFDDSAYWILSKSIARIILCIAMKIF
jgi:hypothetical protein